MGVTTSVVIADVEVSMLQPQAAEFASQDSTISTVVVRCNPQT